MLAQASSLRCLFLANQLPPEGFAGVRPDPPRPTPPHPALPCASPLVALAAAALPPLRLPAPAMGPAGGRPPLPAAARPAAELATSLRQHPPPFFRAQHHGTLRMRLRPADLAGLAALPHLETVVCNLLQAGTRAGDCVRVRGWVGEGDKWVTHVCMRVCVFGGGRGQWLGIVLG